MTAAGVELMMRETPSDEVVDAIWALVSPEVFLYLTAGRGWSVADVETWMVHMLNATINAAACANTSPLV